ncbi:MAG TPA: type VI secretion system tip protein VgrG [Gemmatimonadaceae bacterium]|nr:type VI secretion system tip protein VgrG [Gemmatimonadaceae bacterium]
MPDLTQANRPIAVTTAAGTDVLLLEGFSGVEGVSMPFRFRLRMVSENASLSADALLHTPATITVRRDDGNDRYIHGMFSRFVQLGRDVAVTHYEAELVPQLWFLSLKRDARIFQNKSVPQIVEQVLADAGLTDYKLKLVGNYSPLEYCVQYRETDLAFVSRLLEQEGIFYFFEHTDGAHTLVLADSPSAVAACPGAGPLRVSPQSRDTTEADDVVFELVSEASVFTGKVALRDYNFQTPNTSLAVQSSGDGNLGELYDYPGKYEKTGDGNSYARVRLDMLEAQRKMVHGRGNCPLLVTGHKFDIKEHYRRDLNQSYFLLRVEHDVDAGDFITRGGAPYRYECRFSAIPASVPYRPPLETPRPVVHGSQTAVVVGKAGEEIWVDKYGRVKVQFFWDRVGQKDENSSCWVRVASTWAGKNWGFIQLPRIGQEVIVDFLEGDPDRPIITGRVYNADQMPPYTLPANQTQSGLKTRSSKGGGTEDYNELRFEDKKGSEQIVMHAQKDLLVEVENDETRNVLHDRTTTIKNDETLEVTEGNEKITVKKGNQTVNIDMGNQSITLGQGNQTIEIKMGNQSTTVKMGDITTKANLGSISSEAMQAIELKVGANSIKIDQSGITIKGMMVKVMGDVQAKMDSPMTQVTASGILQLKGSLTTIN